MKIQDKPFTPVEKNVESKKSCSIISRINSSVVNSFSWFISLFLRYLGSKSFLNCHYNFEKIITKDEARKYLDHFALAWHAFNENPEEMIIPLGWEPINIEEFGPISPSFQKTKYGMFDKQSALKIVAAQKGDELMIGVSGSMSSRGNGNHMGQEDDYVNGFKRDPAKVNNILGAVPYIYTQAEDVISKMVSSKACMGKKLTLVGHCFGGSIVSYVGLKKNIKTVTINSMPLGAGLQYQVGRKRLKEADSIVTNICVKKDWLTDVKVISVFDRILSFFQIRTPGSFGRQYLIPNPFKGKGSRDKAHGLTVPALMAYLGHSTWDTPRTVYGRNRS